jgi:hypothetical protein
LEGRVFGVSYGAANKDIVSVGTFGTQAATIDLDEFDLLQTIPATVAVIPVYFKVAFVGIGAAGATQAVLAWGNTGVISGGITAVPYNFRPASDNLSATTVVGLGADGGTALVVAGVIYHEASTALTGVAGTPAQLGYEWSVKQAGYLPVLEGLAGTGRQVIGCAHGHTTTGYMTYAFAELPIAAVA